MEFSKAKSDSLLTNVVCITPSILVKSITKPEKPVFV